MTQLRQSNMFEGEQGYKIVKPIRLIEFFAGYGSQNLALKYLGANYEHWVICEWAVKSIQAYKDMHCPDDNTDYSAVLSKEEVIQYLFNKGVSMDYNQPMTLDQIKKLGEAKQRQIYNNIIASCNLVNIQQARGADLNICDKDKYEYMMTYSYPCQSLSMAGKHEGMTKGSGTRSSMLWEVERILDELQQTDALPQILVMENVPQVHGKKNIADFKMWVDKLTSLGYASYWTDLNARDFGVPQNRMRCFMVSILGGGKYVFPKGEPLSVCLRDLLQPAEEVDEKYFLSDAMKRYIAASNEKWTGNNGGGIVNRKVASTLNTGEGQRRCDASNYICDQLPEDFNLNDLNKVIVFDKLGNKFKIRNTKQLRETIERNELQDGSSLDLYNRTVHNDGISQTLDTGYHNAQRVCVKTAPYYLLEDLRIRKLTPKEAFRLMGVRDEDFEMVKHNQSNSSLMHLAGDSIVVGCLSAIFKNLM